MIWNVTFPEAVPQRCSVKKVFLEISQNLQENTCATVSLAKRSELYLLMYFVDKANKGITS